MYGWIPLLFPWNYQNIVNQLNSSTKLKVFFLSLNPSFWYCKTWSNLLSCCESISSCEKWIKLSYITVFSKIKWDDTGRVLVKSKYLMAIPQYKIKGSKGKGRFFKVVFIISGVCFAYPPSFLTSKLISKLSLARLFCSGQNSHNHRIQIFNTNQLKQKETIYIYRDWETEYINGQWSDHESKENSDPQPL